MMTAALTLWFALSSVGNRRLRVLVDANVDRYAAATNKMQKSMIVSSIVETVNEAAGAGGFVKRDSATNRWLHVSDDAAREKVGSVIRSHRKRSCFGLTWLHGLFVVRLDSY
jgi:hypothetical protein